MITNVPCLTEEECQEVSSVIYDLKKFWSQITSGHFYTLGAASYIDAANADKAKHFYYGKAKLLNPILRERFNWLYERISQSLTKELGKPTAYRETLALPGFHIFPMSKGSSRTGGGMHLDLQYKLLNWQPSTGINFENPISFTLAITLPEFGGGINFSDLSSEELIKLTPEKSEEALKNKIRFHAYTVGHIAIHQGLIWHGISPMRNQQLDNDRITLQGHGLLDQDIWQLYW
ncbi:MAG: hypothetical protein HEQ35_06080 [Gloeotrichia echinulata IR180]